MCELVPDRGRGKRDIVRIYYNPVLQQCLPFSWSGTGGNANRFISIKNCYEICHPSDPGFRQMTATGIRPYLYKQKSAKACANRLGVPELGIKPKIKKIKKFKDKDVVVRQIKHPFDPSKTLTIVQPVNYVVLNQKDLQN